MHVHTRVGVRELLRNKGMSCEFRDMDDLKYAVCSVSVSEAEVLKQDALLSRLYNASEREDAH